MEKPKKPNKPKEEDQVMDGLNLSFEKAISILSQDIFTPPEWLKTIDEFNYSLNSLQNSIRALDGKYKTYLEELKDNNVRSLTDLYKIEINVVGEYFYGELDFRTEIKNPNIQSEIVQLFGNYFRD